MTPDSENTGPANTGIATGIFADLMAIHHFLSEDVASRVPAQLRAEVRAAGKVLGDIAREIDALPALLLAECAAMLALCDENLGEHAGSPAARQELTVEIARLRHQLALPSATLSGQLRLHAALKGHVELILIELINGFDQTPKGSSEKAAIGQRIEAIYATLARQADARLPWQSVFRAASTHTPPFTRE